MSRRKLTRRQFVAATALSSAALVAAPFVRTARAAGSLSIGFWDHWVPGANKTSTDLVNEWAAKEKVEVQIDYITSNGRKNEITIAAEAQAFRGDEAGAVRCIAEGDALGLVDVTWADRCPLFESMRGSPLFVAVRDRIAARAKEALDVLEGRKD